VQCQEDHNLYIVIQIRGAWVKDFISQKVVAQDYAQNLYIGFTQFRANSKAKDFFLTSVKYTIFCETFRKYMVHFFIFETELKHIDRMNTNFKAIYSIISFFC
jgi:hypothetical protein